MTTQPKIMATISKANQHNDFTREEYTDLPRKKQQLLNFLKHRVVYQAVTFPQHNSSQDR
jgi:hypothetical protein